MRIRSSVIAVLAVVALAGCATSTPVVETASPEPTASATPTTTPVVMPTDCATLVASDVYAATFGETPLNSPIIAEAYPLGVLDPAEPAAGVTVEEAIASGVELRCLWRDPNADVTFLEVEVGTVDPALGSGYLDGLPAVGYDCEEALGGRRCQIVGTNDMYPVEEGTTVYMRDGVFISVEQANFPTNGLLDAVVLGIWA